MQPGVHKHHAGMGIVDLASTNLAHPQVWYCSDACELSDRDVHCGTECAALAALEGVLPEGYECCIGEIRLLIRLLATLFSKHRDPADRSSMEKEVAWSPAELLVFDLTSASESYSPDEFESLQYVASLLQHLIPQELCPSTEVLTELYLKMRVNVFAMSQNRSDQGPSQTDGSLPPPTCATLRASATRVPPPSLPVPASQSDCCPEPNHLSQSESALSVRKNDRVLQGDDRDVHTEMRQSPCPTHSHGNFVGVALFPRASFFNHRCSWRPALPALFPTLSCLSVICPNI